MGRRKRPSDRMARHAVRCEPVSGGNSLHLRECTGNFRTSGLQARDWFLSVRSQFPSSKEQGIYGPTREKPKHFQHLTDC